ncbi:MAG: hypothetical protein ABSG74_12110 [Candidatus Bathyarchaeia archaeon]
MSSENDYVARELEKSGLPLEIEAAELLEAHDWEVMPSVFYLDHDDNQYKETDILAYDIVARPLKGSPNHPYMITIGVIIECKKRADIILVFFPRTRKPTDIDYGGTALGTVDSFQVAKQSSFRALSPRPIPPQLELSVQFNLEPKAYVPLAVARQIWGVNQLPDMVQARDFHCLSLPQKCLSFDVVKSSMKKGKFSRNDERRDIHDALTGLAKTLEYRLEKEAEMLQVLLEGALNDDLVREQPHLRQFSLCYFFPVLVFDGEMKIWKRGVVSDADEILYEVPLRSGKYFQDRFVNIVTKDHFENWLEQLHSDGKSLVEKIIKNKSTLDKQVELMLSNRIFPPK